MKKTYVLEQRNANFENEVKTLKSVMRPIIEVNDKETQIEGDVSDMGVMENQPMDVDVDEEQTYKKSRDKDHGKYVYLQNMCPEKISQNIHNSYISLQGVEY